MPNMWCYEGGEYFSEVSSAPCRVICCNLFVICHKNYLFTI